MDAQPAKILVIEDNPSIADVLCRLLKLLHYDPTLAQNAVRGLELAEYLHPACILIDMIMSGMDGHMFVQTVRQHPSLAQTPMIMMTAAPLEGERKKALAEGVDAFVPKPFRPGEIEKAIRAAIQMHNQNSLSDDTPSD